MKGLVTNDDGKLLIVRGGRDRYWELPGGKLEFNEQPEETLKREIGEELGIEDAEIGELLGTFAFWAEDEEGEWQFLVLAYTCGIGSVEIKLSDEHEELEWVAAEDIKKYPMREGYYKIIENYGNGNK